MRLVEMLAGLERAAERDVFHQMLALAPDAFVVVTGGRRIAMVNSRAEELFGYDRERLLGSDALVLCAMVGCERWEALLGPFLRERRASGPDGGHPVQGEVRFGRSDGSHFLAEVNLSPLDTPEGRLVLCAVRDVTQRRVEQRALAAAKALAEARRDELESFSYSVAHDLRAPLRAIDGFTQILEEEHSGELPPDAVELLARVRRAGRRMSSLIDDLLALARVTSTTISPTEVDLGELALAAVERLREEQPQRRVDVEVDPGLLCHGDSRLLGIAMDNLLSNAWKFTARQEHPRIRVGRTAEGPAPEFVIADNGVGFDMSRADRLFAPFQRLHGDDEFEGTGVGLATVDRIIRRHGGRIRPESAPGRGAAFFFTLPLAVDVAALPEELVGDGSVG